MVHGFNELVQHRNNLDVINCWNLVEDIAAEVHAWVGAELERYQVVIVICEWDQAREVMTIVTRADLFTLSYAMTIGTRQQSELGRFR